MLFIVSLLLAALFTYFAKDLLKKKPYIFYVTAVVLILAVSCIPQVGLPQFIRNYLIGVISKGCLGTALFVIVMYTGALPQGHKWAGPLFKIRGELSITASCLVLAHNITYGKTYFKALFTQPQNLPGIQLLAACISCILIALMLVLTITSFPIVRKKMNPRNWKKLQRSAYVFYGLIYVHVMLISFYYGKFGSIESQINIVVYSLIFLNYAFLRIRKALLRRNPEGARQITISLASIFGISFCVLSIFAFAPSLQGTGNQIQKELASNSQAENVTETSSEQRLTELDSSESKETETSQTEVAQTENGGNAEEAAEKEAITEVAGIKAGQDSLTDQNNTTEEQPSTQEQSKTEEQKPAEEQSPAGEQTPTVSRVYKADGTYVGYDSVPEYGYDVTCTITIVDDKIKSVSFTTTDTGANAIYISTADGLRNVLKRNGSSDGVDAMSGATYTSEAYMRAFDQAVASAK